MNIPLSGIGYDVHRFIEGRPLILGGVEIPHPLGLDGHSDADVLCHAIADAILGALGHPDIGHYFPPGDPDCAGIDSLKIVAKAAAEVRHAGGRLCNIDAMLILEAPRVMPHVPAMKSKLALALGIPEARVGLKATTNEKMGFVGRQEGIAALATAQLLLPVD